MKKTSDWRRAYKFALQFDQEDHARFSNEMIEFTRFAKKLSSAIHALHIESDSGKFDEPTKDTVDQALNVMENTQHSWRALSNYFTGRAKPETKDNSLLPFQELLQKGILPFAGLTNPEYSADFRYAATVLAGERHKAWMKNNSKTKNHYNSLEESVKEYREENSLDYFVDESHRFDLWLNAMNKIAGFSCNGKFLKMWGRRFLKKLKNNEPVKWSLGDDAAGICKEYSDLYVDEDYISLFGREKVMLDHLKRAKKQAQFTPPDIVESPVYPRYGLTSLIPFRLEQQNNDIFVIFNSIFEGQEPIRAKIIPHKKTESWTLDKHSKPIKQKDIDAKPKFRTAYTISMRRPSDQNDVVLDIAEIALSFRAAVSRGNISFDDYCVCISRKGNSEATNKLECALTFFKTALGSPTKKTDGTDPNAKVRVPQSLRISFMDVGINPAAIIETFRYDQRGTDGTLVFAGKNGDQPFGSAKNIPADSLIIGSVKDERLLSRIKSLHRKTKDAHACLGFFKGITKLVATGQQTKSGLCIYARVLDRDRIEDIYNVPIKSLINLNLVQTFNWPDKLVQGYLDGDESLIEHLSENLNQDTLGHFYTRLVELIRTTIFTEWQSIKDSRGCCVGTCSLGPEMFGWLDLTDSLLSLKKSLQYSCKLPLKAGERRNKDDFKYLKQYLVNLATEASKQLCAKIRKWMVANNIDVLVGEEGLEQFKTSICNDKGLNKLLSRWSHRTLFGRLKESLEAENKVFDLVDSRHSSQIYVYNNRLIWGARDNVSGHGDKSKLWIEIDGNVSFVNSDISACHVLAHRYFTRQAEILYLRACSIKGHPDLFLVISAGKKRLGGFLNRTVGSHYGVIDANGTLSKITKKRYDDLFKLRGKRAEFYRHGEKWLCKDQHKQWQKDLVNRGRASGQVTSKSPQPLARHKLIQECNLGKMTTADQLKDGKNRVTARKLRPKVLLGTI